MIDDDDWFRATKDAGRGLVLREEQSGFHSDLRASGDVTGMTPWPGARVDHELVEHSQAAVDRLTLLVSRAVRTSDDAAVSALDHVLQQAETLLALAQGDSPVAAPN